MKLSHLQKQTYAAQDKILAAFSKMKSFPFVLSGGTALSRFYFHHRFSEDLDFFFKGFTYSFAFVDLVINALRKEAFLCDLVGRTDEPGRLKFAGYVITQDKVSVKVDFLEDPFSGMWLPVHRKSDSGLVFEVDHPDQIYYRKFYSLLEQWHHTKKIRREKDLIDLYFLHRYHQKIERTMVLYRRNHVPIDEEKIIMILGSLKRGSLREIYRRALVRASNLLLKEGLGK